MKEKIMSFRGNFAFLSNMYAADFEWDGRVYHNSEAAFQSAKSLDPAERDRFSEMNGVTAKRAGRRVQLRWDWEDVKDSVMEEVVRAKFSQNADLAKKLVDTGALELVEGNRWHDAYWGVDLLTGKGENRLGIILMKIRQELGGADYRESMARLAADRETEIQRRREAVQQKINSAQAQLDALPDFDFVGLECMTKAFGRVTITRREGNYLFFTARGEEKKFALPGCIAQGFLMPEDEAVVANFVRRQELAALLKEYRRELAAIQ